MKGVVATGAAFRGSAVTAWLALLGFAVQQKLGLLAVLAALVAAFFMIADGYHGWLYAHASRHARRTEWLMSSYYDFLSRGDDDPDELPRFRARLRAHRIGLFDNFDTPFRLVELRRARPSVVYRLLYPALILIAAFFAAGIFVGFLTPTSAPTVPIPVQLVPSP